MTRAFLPRAAASLVALGLLVALLAPSAAGAPVVVVRVFTLKNRSADEALTIVKPLLSSAGSVMLEPRTNELTVRDTAASVEHAAQAIAAYDVPLRGVDVSVTLLKATHEARTPKKADPPADSGEVKGITEKLKRLFNVTDVTRVDSVVVRGMEGQRIACVIGGTYRLQFFLAPSPDAKRMQLRDLSLERVRREGGSETYGGILRTSVNVSMGQHYILVVSKDEGVKDALFLALYTDWQRPGPGI